MSQLAISSKTTGIAEIDRRLAALAGSEARKVVRAGVGAGLTLLAKEMRSQTRAANVSAPLKTALLKTIGKRFAKAKAGSQKGTLQAKAGFTVGKKQPKNKGSGRGRPGVGISAQNAHWAILGTDDRDQAISTRVPGRRGQKVRIRSTSHPTGRMPQAPPIVKSTAAAAGGKIYATVNTAARSKLEQVVRSLP